VKKPIWISIQLHITVGKDISMLLAVDLKDELEGAEHKFLDLFSLGYG